MRNASWLVVVLVACGGANPPPQTPPPNQVPVTQTPTTPAAPVGLTKDVCAQRSDDFGPVALRADQVAFRRGTGAKTFAEIESTRETPIEVCMPGGEREWLMKVSCAGGASPTPTAAKPSADKPAAPTSNNEPAPPSPPARPPAPFQRSGSVGPGGTCGSVIDLYVVTCPEKQYEVFMDMYMCPPGEGR